MKLILIGDLYNATHYAGGCHSLFYKIILTYLFYKSIFTVATARLPFASTFVSFAYNVDLDCHLVPPFQKVEVIILGAIFIVINSWNNNLHAYGIST